MTNFKESSGYTIIFCRKIEDLLNGSESEGFHKLNQKYFCRRTENEYQIVNTLEIHHCCHSSGPFLYKSLSLRHPFVK